MRRIVSLVLFFGLAISSLATAPAQAQATRTWVSGVGDDVNPCSRTAPCKTFAGAISKTAAGGEINCLDPAGYGTVTITKSMTISCEGVTGSILGSFTNGINFNGLPTDYLVVKGLDIEGGGNGLNGINFLAGGFLHVEDCNIRHFTGSGILIQPTSSARFAISRTTLFSNGGVSTGAGVRIAPSSGTMKGTIEWVLADRNTYGIAVDGTTGVSALTVAIRDSVMTDNSNAALVAVGAKTIAHATRSSMTNSATGVQNAEGATIRVGSSTIIGNVLGVSANVTSYGNNELNGNTTDGTMAAIALH
ncbi:right-handed parallel beta-helix repeat-containing protein [Bradyrhizobium sp. 930_D9_N1_4]|uniref:right-handed parallel beta-helix repeat-containing protein n=1 Tax=Bradyrhizobium sp. 930_D9_N1_4 TaxID=3240374 RepID=UPI003F89C6DA